MRRILRVWRMSCNDLRLLWLALRHPNRPTWLLAATLALGFFALEPFNIAIPVLLQLGVTLEDNQCARPEPQLSATFLCA
jgi:hypothetical protein